MTQRETQDQDLARAVRTALAARDAALPAPSFADSSTTTTRHRAFSPWRSAFAALALAVVVAALSWTLRGPGPRSAPDALDPVLARELSSDDFWRVPSDELLAYADPAANVVLPSPRTLEISLEESLL